MGEGNAQTRAFAIAPVVELNVLPSHRHSLGMYLLFVSLLTSVTKLLDLLSMPA